MQYITLKMNLCQTEESKLMFWHIEVLYILFYIFLPVCATNSQTLPEGSSIAVVVLFGGSFALEFISNRFPTSRTFITEWRA